MFRLPSLVVHCVVIASALVIASSGFSKSEDWKDTQGNKFHGEPSELWGPIAVFRTSRDTGRRVAVQLLAPEDCVRLHEGLRDKPARANQWSHATGEAARELIGRVMRVEKGALVAADLAHRPEPGVIIAFYVNQANKDSWEMMNAALAPFAKLQQSYPGLVEGVMYGVQHTKTDHASMAVGLNVPWLVTDFYEQGYLDSFNRFLPEEYRMMVLTREGVPLFSADKPTPAEVAAVFSDLSGFLDLVRPENPKGWAARGYYLSVVQPVIFAHGHADPVLVGNPLMAEGLKQRKVLRFDADILVGADGKVTEVKMKKDELLPEKMSAPIADGLKKAVFVPAVQDGKFVDGAYRYHFDAAR